MTEHYANHYATRLTEAMTAVATTLEVASVTGIPTAPFRAVIGRKGAYAEEIVIVTDVTGLVLTVTRAAEAYGGVQTATKHHVGATFTASITAAGLLNVASLDVRAYGAVGDGTTDDTTAIQAAIDAANTAGGGTVLLPAGTFMASAVALKSNVVLAGLGQGVTTLKQIVGTNADFITLATVNTEFVGMRSLTIHGNSFNDAGTLTGNTSGRGVYLNNTAGTFTYSDPYHTFRDVFVVHTSGDAWSLTAGTRASTFDNCRGRLSSTGRGWTIAGTDCFFVNSHGETNATSGFYISGTHNHFIGCKAFSNGYAITAAGDEADGFWVYRASRNEFTNCEAQDNQKDGVRIYGVESTRNQWIGGLSDSNAVSSLTVGCGYRIDAGIGNVIIGAATNGHSTQDYGVILSNAPSQNTVHVKLNGNTTQFATTGSVGANDVVLNGNDGGTETVAYASPYVPSPSTGQIKAMTLTGALSVSAVLSSDRWVGARLTFIFTQDGTGGRVVTFNAAYKTNWTPDTTAAKVNIISFLFDGTSWLQTAASTGL